MGRKLHFSLFLALVVCNYFLQSHGRPIPKSLNQDSSVKPEKEVESSHDANAFQPTAPGNSPGVGHKHSSEDDSKVKTTSSPDVKVSVTVGSTDDFKRTDPGHSPGVGHDYPNKIGHLN